MKRIYFLFAVSALLTYNANSQVAESMTDTSGQKMKHEVGLNATFMLKQVLNFSSTSFDLLPYDVTYKMIFKKAAFRTGIGFIYSNTSSQTTNSSSSMIAGPDPIPENKDESAGVFFRAGIEGQKPITSRIILYYGVDAIIESNRAESRNVTVFNSLPVSYSYFRSEDETREFGVGGGPVAGIQFMINKRLGFFTECPVYFVSQSQTTKSSEYTNFLSNSTGGYIRDESSATTSVETKKINLFLPVTVYFSIKF